MQPVLAVSSVTRCFGDLVAVDQLSFEVQRGELFGLLGPNGAGKTTTLHLITGLLRRQGGEIRVMGYDPEAEAQQIRRCTGLAPQETNVYEDLSALDNLWHHAALYCADLSDVETRIEGLLTLMNLWSRRKDAVRTFSGGMKRRLALARALLHDPEIILFDEPTLGVDVQGRHALWDHIRQQRAEGKTFLLSTNDMAEADALCDRLVIIDHGQAIALDTPENLKAGLGRDIVTLRTSPPLVDAEALLGGLGIQAISHPQPGLVRFEVADAESLAGELISMVTVDHHLESVRIARPSLDDVFLHHTGRALRE
ncbi:MAG: ATP-binding cassette domain-containing protein [Anaerolineae bacterium]|jgi:ABC-type multidrug transport system ATPase subunit